MSYSEEMEYIEASMRALLYRDKGNIREAARQAAITPTHPALLLVQDMRLYDEWLDTAYSEGKDDALVDGSSGVGYAPELDGNRIVYIVTGYRTLKYPAMAKHIERAYLKGYAAGIVVE